MSDLSALSSLRQASNTPDIQVLAEGWESFAEGNQASLLSSAPSQRKQYSTRRTSDERLDLFFDFLQNNVQWTLRDLFQALCSSTNPKNCHHQKALAEAAYNTLAVLTFNLALSKTVNQETCVALLNALQCGSPELCHEIKQLGTTNIFGEYDGSSEDMSELNSHNLISAITQQAPNVLDILQRIAEPQEASKERENEH